MHCLKTSKAKGKPEDMPKPNIRLSNLAIEDLVQIEAYTARTWGDVQVKQYMQKLKTRFYWLGENPALGKQRPELGKSVLSFPEEQHVIYYRVTDTCLEVARILHKSMDVEAQGI